MTLALTLWEEIHQVIEGHVRKKATEKGLEVINPDLKNWIWWCTPLIPAFRGTGGQIT